MTRASMDRSAEQFGVAVTELGSRWHPLSYADLPGSVRARVDLAVLDLLGVALAGIRTPEVSALVAAADPVAGSHPLLGTGRSAGAVDSAWFPAVAAAWLELDEGNKHAVGHPAAHVVFAALAAARSSSSPVDGDLFLGAVAGGYELAARVGRSVRRGPRWHPHGHWGVLGAAWAAAYVRGLDRDDCLAAVGAAGSLMRVTPWPVVLEGDVTRNLWMADAVPAGLRAADLAAAGLAPSPSSAYHGLSLVGEVDVASLTADPDRWLCGEGYLKLHSACSYTHPAIDLVHALRHVLPEADAVEVKVGSLAAPLLGREVPNRLAAMFSLPFAVATVWAHGVVSPSVMDPSSEAFARSLDLLDRVTVEVDASLDAWLPTRRVAEATLRRGDESVSLAAPNPVGDADHFPLDLATVRRKLVSLLGEEDAGRVADVASSLAGSDDVVPVLAGLP